MTPQEKKAATDAARQKAEKDKVLEELRKIPVIHVACSRARVARTNFYRWQRQDEEFRKVVRDAMEDGNLLINDMSESQLIAMIQDKNFSAIRLWLRHHHAAYGHKVEIALESPPEALSPAQEAVVQEALRLAALIPDEDDDGELAGRHSEENPG